ncbi:MAG: hypothetical protein AB1498_03615, partial [bacterium]
LGESLLKKVIGKPCEGKLQARFDEGMLETERKFCASVLLYNNIMQRMPWGGTADLLVCAVHVSVLGSASLLSRQIRTKDK